MHHNNPSPIGRFTRWLFGAPFQELPTEFGDSVPSELRVFEAQSEEAQHHVQRRAVALPVDRHHPRARAVRQNNV